MITNYVFRTPGVILEKLNRLLIVLQKAKRAFEQAASTIDNKQLRYCVLGLAQETKQYANELASHIEILGGETGKWQGGIEFSYDGLGEKIDVNMDDEKHRLQICTGSEKQIMQVYREVLNEPFLYENIRKMIRYQMNGMMHLFSQIRLLNASLQKETN